MATTGEIDCINSIDTLKEDLSQKIYVIILIIVILSSLIAWIWLSRSNIYLKKRSFSAILINAIGQIAVVFPGSFPYLTGSVNSASFCWPANLLLLATIPLITTSILATTLSFYFRAKLTKKLSMSIDSTSSWDWFLGSTKFSIVVLALSLLTVFGSTSIAAFFYCPSKHNDTCLLLTLNDAVTLGFTLGLGSCVTFVVVYLQYQLRTYPDPFRILIEFRTATLGTLVIGLITIITTLSYARPSLLLSTATNFAVHFFFFWLCPVQIYKATKFNKVSVMNAEYSLEKVLKDDTGYRMLRKHLQNEFSLENLLFLDAVNEFRGDQDAERKLFLAKKIYTTFIKDRYLNISSQVYSQLHNLNEYDEMVSDNLFDDAYVEISNLIELDALSRLIKKPEFLLYSGTTNNVLNMRELKP